jgi:hypothetical protein
MRHWRGEHVSFWRRAIGSLLLVVTALTLPTPALRCACAGQMAARMAAVAGHGCPRCHESAAPTSTPRLSAARCCRAQLAPTTPGVAPARVALDRIESISSVALVPHHAAVMAVAIDAASRAPPDIALRSGAPPDSYLSDTLRL